MSNISFIVPTALRLTPSLHHKTLQCETIVKCNSSPTHKASSRRSFGKMLGTISAACLIPQLWPLKEGLAARPEGVNRPDLLPKEFTTVIDLERFLASGEIRRLKEKIADLEKRTGFKIRLLTQRFPQTPGLAIRDYWQVDDNSVIIVADYFGGSGQLLKFNVGRNVDKLLAPRFWSVLSSSFGNKFYVEKNGESVAIINSVESIRTCLLRDGCTVPPNLNVNP